EGRHALERTIGVPHLVTGVEADALVVRRDHLAIGIDVGEIRDLRQIAFVRDDRTNRRLERAETPAEGNLLAVVHPLVAKEQDRMLVERGDEVGEDIVGDTPNVDTDNFDAEQRMERSSLECHLTLRSSYGAEYGWSAMRPSPDSSTRGPIAFRKPSSQSGALVTRS